MVNMDPLPNVKQDKIKLTEINDYLTCKLCKGYLIDATTISECLHSFCRSCIIRFLQDNSHCPTCEMIINKAKPNLKMDKTLQDIVYKLVPELFMKEMARRQRFYKNRPEAIARTTPEERGVDTERTIFNPKDAISLSIEYISDDSTPGAINVPDAKLQGRHDGSQQESQMKRFLQCPGNCRIEVLKKFVQNKYNVDVNSFHIEILYKRVPLPNHYTLIDIAYIYSWKRSEPMKFFFRILDKSSVEKAEKVVDHIFVKPPKVRENARRRTNHHKKEATPEVANEGDGSKVYTNITLNRSNNVEIITKVQKVSNRNGQPIGLNIIKKTVKKPVKPTVENGEEAENPNILRNSEGFQKNFDLSQMTENFWMNHESFSRKDKENCSRNGEKLRNSPETPPDNFSKNFSISPANDDRFFPKSPKFRGDLEILRVTDEKKPSDHDENCLEIIYDKRGGFSKTLQNSPKNFALKNKKGGVPNKNNGLSKANATENSADGETRTECEKRFEFCGDILDICEVNLHVVENEDVDAKDFTTKTRTQENSPKINGDVSQNYLTETNDTKIHGNNPKNPQNYLKTTQSSFQVEKSSGKLDRDHSEGVENDLTKTNDSKSHGNNSKLIQSASKSVKLNCDDCEENSKKLNNGSEGVENYLTKVHGNDPKCSQNYPNPIQSSSKIIEENSAKLSREGVKNHLIHGNDPTFPQNYSKEKEEVENDSKIHRNNQKSPENNPKTIQSDSKIEGNSKKTNHDCPESTENCLNDSKIHGNNPKIPQNDSKTIQNCSNKSDSKIHGNSPKRPQNIPKAIQNGPKIGGNSEKSYRDHSEAVKHLNFPQNCLIETKDPKIHGNNPGIPQNVPKTTQSVSKIEKSSEKSSCDHSKGVKNSLMQPNDSKIHGNSPQKDLKTIQSSSKTGKSNQNIPKVIRSCPKIEENGEKSKHDSEILGNNPGIPQSDPKIIQTSSKIGRSCGKLNHDHLEVVENCSIAASDSKIHGNNLKTPQNDRKTIQSASKVEGDAQKSKHHCSESVKNDLIKAVGNNSELLENYAECQKVNGSNSKVVGNSPKKCSEKNSQFFRHKSTMENRCEQKSLGNNSPSLGNNSKILENNSIVSAVTPKSMENNLRNGERVIHDAKIFQNKFDGNCLENNSGILENDAMTSNAQLETELNHGNVPQSHGSDLENHKCDTKIFQNCLKCLGNNLQNNGNLQNCEENGKEIGEGREENSNVTDDSKFMENNNSHIQGSISQNHEDHSRSSKMVENDSERIENVPKDVENNFKFSGNKPQEYRNHLEGQRGHENNVQRHGNDSQINSLNRGENSERSLERTDSKSMENKAKIGEINLETNETNVSRNNPNIPGNDSGIRGNDGPGPKALENPAEFIENDQKCMENDSEGFGNSSERLENNSQGENSKIHGNDSNGNNSESPLGNDLKCMENNPGTRKSCSKSPQDHGPNILKENPSGNNSKCMENNSEIRTNCPKSLETMENPPGNNSKSAENNPELRTNYLKSCENDQQNHDPNSFGDKVESCSKNHGSNVVVGNLEVGKNSTSTENNPEIRESCSKSHGKNHGSNIFGGNLENPPGNNSKSMENNSEISESCSKSNGKNYIFGVNLEMMENRPKLNENDSKRMANNPKVHENVSKTQGNNPKNQKIIESNLETMENSSKTSGNNSSGNDSKIHGNTSIDNPRINRNDGNDTRINENGSIVHENGPRIHGNDSKIDGNNSKNTKTDINLQTNEDNPEKTGCDQKILGNNLKNRGNDDFGLTGSDPKNTTVESDLEPVENRLEIVEGSKTLENNPETIRRSENLQRFDRKIKSDRGNCEKIDHYNFEIEDDREKCNLGAYKSKKGPKMDEEIGGKKGGMEKSEFLKSIELTAKNNSPKAQGGQLFLKITQKRKNPSPIKNERGLTPNKRVKRKTSPPQKIVTASSNEELKQIFSNCKFNIPSSLSITLKETNGEEENKNLKLEPVKNYIEILKLPDQEKFKSRSAPNLTNKSFQTTFEDTIVQGRCQKRALPNVATQAAKRPRFDFAKFKTALPNVIKFEQVSAKLHSPSLGMNFTVSVNQNVKTHYGKLDPKFESFKKKKVDAKIENVSPKTIVEKTPQKPPQKISPKIERTENHVHIGQHIIGIVKKSPTKGGVERPQVVKRPQQVVPILPKPANFEPNALTPNQIMEKYNIQNLAQLTASLNFNPMLNMQPNPMVLQQAILKQFELQNRQNWQLSQFQTNNKYLSTTNIKTE